MIGLLILSSNLHGISIELLRVTTYILLQALNFDPPMNLPRDWNLFHFHSALSTHFLRMLQEAAKLRSGRPGRRRPGRRDALRGQQRGRARRRLQARRRWGWVEGGKRRLMSVGGAGKSDGGITLGFSLDGLDTLGDQNC